MRNPRFLLRFTSSAITILLIVFAAERAFPGLQGRIHVVLGLERASPRVHAEAATGTASVAEVRSEGAADTGGAAAVAFRAADSRLLIPVQGVEASSLLDTYEQARGEGRRHDAIDIMAARGTPVLATADGVVMKLFQSARGGTTLYQLAPDGRTIYYYAHLDRYAPRIAEGRALSRGEVLGYVGNTGDAGSANYHLHFEVSTAVKANQYWGGIPQNPYPLMR